MDFSLTLTAPLEKIMMCLTDYENITKFTPAQLKSIEIIEKKSDSIITEETLEFKTVVKNQIIQQCLHKKLNRNELITEIISGPAKNTVIHINCNDKSSGTEIHVDIDLKLSLKAKILQPIIKKVYKQVLTSTFYRINTWAMEN